MERKQSENRESAPNNETSGRSLCRRAGMQPATKRFLVIVGMVWMGLAGLNAWQGGSLVAAKADSTSTCEDDVCRLPPQKTLAAPEPLVIPVVSAKNDRSPGIRVDAFPFGNVDLTTIRGLQCDGQYIELIMSPTPGSVELFAVVDPNARITAQSDCVAFARGQNKRYAVKFDPKKMRFVIQSAPEFRPI
jgi:hypothetical protein